MRLICPNCDAQYEVMPTDGRDVQCSNCGQTWFQHHPD
ncbi:zinc-ribbon domain-containing protein, partial [Sulfitobacter sp. MF3-043]